MMVVINVDSRCALTAPSMTSMPLLGEILLVNFISSFGCPFPLICKREDDTVLIN
jgi:hypothetical protein